MNWEAIGAVGEVGGTLLVGVTLVYLVIQVRQNTSELRTASRQGVTSGYRAVNEKLLDVSVSEAYSLGLRDYPDMLSSQKRVFAHAINDLCVFFQSTFALLESGTLQQTTYLPYLTWVASNLSTPGGLAWWSETKGFYTSGMANAIDTKLAEGALPDVLGLAFYALDDEEPSQP